MSSDLGFTYTPAITEEAKPSRVKSLAASPLKGFIETIINTFGTESPLEASKRLSKGVGSREEQIQTELQKVLPTQDRPEEELLQRFGSILAIPLPGGGASQVGRAALASLLGQTAKEKGAGPLLQALAEVPAYGLPGLSKTLQPSGDKKALVEAARKLGLTEEQITRSIQEPKKIRTLGKFASKGSKSEEAIRDTQEALGTAISNLRETKAAQTLMSPQVSDKMIEAFKKDLRELPVSARSMILPDFEEFLASPRSIDDTINLWRDINAKYGGKGKALQKSKQALLEGIKEASPEVGEKFEVLNKLYSRFADLKGRLAPGVADDLADLSEKLSLAYGLINNNQGLLKKTFGIIAGRKIAEKALTSPRLQFLGNQFIKAAKQGSLRSIRLAGDKLESELKKTEEKYTVPIPRVVNFD